MNNRRSLLTLLAGATAAFAGYRLFRGDNVMADTAEKTFEVVKSDAEWRRQLDPMQYNVLRNHGTERPGSSALNKEKRKGTFVCAGCDTPLFSSETKYESGTGWPSFYKPLPNAIGTKEDNTFFMRRTEVHCRRCGGHLGHVFDDGPAPTNLRYCMNGVAMKFVPEVDKPA
ncbi:MAG: peptide-methionine (R)-S-oxide reductase MsrB [Rhizobiales bacterium]|nr:peptide-methionine (R)-S-oxide reductase MsrB [Hyphomicrobiales bacterium]